MSYIKSYLELLMCACVRNSNMVLTLLYFSIFKQSFFNHYTLIMKNMNSI